MNIDNFFLHLDNVYLNLQILHQSTFDKEEYLSPLLSALSTNLTTLNRRIAYLSKDSIIEGKLSKNFQDKFFIEDSDITLCCNHPLEVFKDQKWDLGYVDYNHSSKNYCFKSFYGYVFDLYEGLFVRYRI